MITSTIFALVVIALIAAVILALAWGVRKELEHTDEWWTPSEAGKLAKMEYDEKQAVKQQKKILKTINKPNYTRGES